MSLISSRVFIYFILFSMTIIPEVYLPVGRIGFCEIIGILMIISFGFQIYKREFGSFLPLILAPFVIIFAVIYARFIMDCPYNQVYISVILSYFRNIIYVVIGIYCGRTLPVKDFQKVIIFFLILSLFSILIAWGQISSDFILKVTQKLYNPSDFNSLNMTWETRPPGPFVRVFTYSFYTIIIFWLLIYYPSQNISPLLRGTLCGFIVASCVISQTKGALIALTITFLIWSIKHIKTITKKYFEMLLLPIFLFPLLYVLVIWKELTRYAFFIEVMKLDWGSKFDYYFIQDIKSLDSRFSYIEMQWKNFINNPIFGNIYQALVIDQNTDNLYFSQLSIAGILGLLVILAIFYWVKSMKNRYEIVCAKYDQLKYHKCLAFMVYWSIISAYFLGITWNFFVGNRAINILYFFWGILEGSYSNILKYEAKTSY